MRSHDAMGEEIIAAAFASPELATSSAMHHAWFWRQPARGQSPQGDTIPVSGPHPQHRRRLRCDDIRSRLSQRRSPATMRFAECAAAQARNSIRSLSSVSSRPLSLASGIAIRQSIRHTALMIRLDVERLACADEAKNISMLSELARRVATARRMMDCSR